MVDGEDGGPGDDDDLDVDAAITDELVMQEEPAPRPGRELHFPPGLLQDLPDDFEAALLDNDVDGAAYECESSGGLFIDLGNGITRCCQPDRGGCTMCTDWGVCIQECWTRECCEIYGQSDIECLAPDVPPRLLPDILDVDAIMQRGEPAESQDEEAGAGPIETGGPSDSGETGLPAVQHLRRGRMTRGR
jgi:hypothetical protein